MSTYIEHVVFYLLCINLTNRLEVENLKEELVRDGTNLCNQHLETHSIYCDCREHERTLVLFHVISVVSCHYKSLRYLVKK